MTRKRRRRYLPDLTRGQAKSLEAALSAATKHWGAEGWAIVGVPPRLRAAILVSHRISVPRAQTLTLELPPGLGGAELELTILATNRNLDGEALKLARAPGIDFLAPGSPVLIDGARVGLGAVVKVGGVPHIVSCGHPVSDSGSLTTLDGTPIGSLALNLYTGADGTDAALFEVLDAGLALLHAGANEVTWATDIHEPESSDNGVDALFYPTHRDNGSPFLSPVRAFSSCAPKAGGCGAIMLDRCTALGDSGSVLMFEDSFYGIASRRSGNFSFFTPLATVARMVKQQLGKPSLWSPS